MSIEKPAMDEEEARRKARKAARFEIGTFVRVGSGSWDESEQEYVFPLILRSPKVILNETRDEAIDVRFLSELEVGKMRVDTKSGEVERPNRNTIKRKVRERDNEIDLAVQKALISASGKEFSHLPFPENQYAPLQDILSQLLLDDELSVSQIELMDRGGDKYDKYVDNLVDVDLVKKDGRTLRSGDILITIQRRTDSFHEALNAALGHYFENNLSEFGMIKRTLGPYLVLAGYYYRRAIELEELPVIEEWELRRAIESEYTGKQKEEKLFKLSRYLIQLEQVGILESVHQNGTRYWTGNGEIRDRIVEQSDYLGPVESLLA